VFDWLLGKKKVKLLSAQDTNKLLKASIKVDGQGLYVWQHERSLLDVLDKAGLPVRSSCRNGNCGACIAYLIKGEVGYVKTVHFPLEKNELLMCSCVPIGDIEIALPLHPIDPRKRKRSSY
jgi:ferredoxin